LNTENDLNERITENDTAKKPYRENLATLAGVDVEEELVSELEKAGY
jgi:hypothetical protein